MGTEEGKVEEFHKNGNIKTSYKMTDGKMTDGLFKVYDEKGYLEFRQLEFYKNNKPLVKYESHKLIIKEQGEEFRKGKWYDKDNFIFMTIIDEKTQKPFSGEYVYIDKSKRREVNLYNFKNGKLNGKFITFFLDDNSFIQKIEFKDGVRHGFYEFTMTTTNGKIISKEEGQYNLNKKDGTWVTLDNGKKTQQIWSNGIKQN